RLSPVTPAVANPPRGLHNPDPACAAPAEKLPSGPLEWGNHALRTMQQAKPPISPSGSNRRHRSSLQAFSYGILL
ncbi:hypothetical protein ACO22_07264, partial [Paracoccidioides brasiliensis]